MGSCGDRVERIHAAGMKAMTWFEAFGTAGSIYAAQLKRDGKGDWIRSPTDPTLTRVFLNHWAWQLFDGSGELRWIGVHNYFNDENFAQPYTRTHPRYGCPPMTYPDGAVAAGYDGPASDPRNSRIYDAGCAKDVFGNVTFAPGFSAKVNEIDPATGKPRDPDLAALAIKQARGDLVEAVFLLRAYRTTLPRMGASEPIDTGRMKPRRRISAAFKDLPGGQVLGPTFDYTPPAAGLRPGPRQRRARTGRPGRGGPGAEDAPGDRPPGPGRADRAGGAGR